MAVSRSLAPAASTFPADAGASRRANLETTNERYATCPGTSFSSPYVAGTVALCIADGQCAGLTPAQIIQKMVSDAAAYNDSNPGYGFTGDPLHSPDPSKFYGYLIHAGSY